MKCLVLAGGRGERLWPLSRKNYPKQFIQIRKNHSIFQETIARNMPFCDEFIIVTSYEYRFVIENQMQAFQGISYRCIFEEEPRKTTAAILLACLPLQASEYVFVVASDHIVDSDEAYKDAILTAKDYAKQGNIVLFGMKDDNPDPRYGYITGVNSDGTFRQFVERPDEEFFKQEKDAVYRNFGNLIFENGTFINEVQRLQPNILKECQTALLNSRQRNNFTLYTADNLHGITPMSIEKSILMDLHNIRMVETKFSWEDVGSLEDVGKSDYTSEGISVINDCNNATVINTSERQAVVVNKLDDVIVVNTQDAVYVSRYGKSSSMKEILKDYPELKPYGDKGTLFYRSWGYYEELVGKSDYRVRQAFIFPGKTIYAHRHEHRQENWSIVKGNAMIILDDESDNYSAGDNIAIPIGMKHQISNIGDEMLIIIESAVGEIIHEADMVSGNAEDLNESKLGFDIDPLVKLTPAYKDYLWGGNKLRDVFGMKCDYDIIAESWLLSAHKAGQSVIASGRHKGMNFAEYLSVIGKEALGWKCAPLQNFPLLIKFIDAKSDLSVQVHPEDDYALENEKEYGKNEMWYVIDAEPGAGLYVGFKEDTSREEVSKKVMDKTIMDSLNFVPTKPGDVFFIPAGTVHAIGAGNLICEIQQNSDSTYRLYDYDRVDKYGKRRPLHLEKALDVIDYKKYSPVEFEMDEMGKGTVLSRCKYFESVIYDIEDSIKIDIDETKFISLVCIEGDGKITLGNTAIDIRAGESIFVPAQSGSAMIRGRLKIIISYI